MLSVWIGACCAPLGLKTIFVGASPARWPGLGNGRAVGARSRHIAAERAWGFQGSAFAVRPSIFGVRLEQQARFFLLVSRAAVGKVRSCARRFIREVSTLLPTVIWT